MLHIINKSPFEKNAFDACLAVAQDGAVVLLIEDAVYAATTGNPAASQLEQAQGRLKLYVLKPDLEARGMGDRLIPAVAATDYEGFVDLVADNKVCQSWL